MRILIIEDNESKYKTTLEYVKKVQPDAVIEWEQYAKGGVIRLINEHFDFVIVDMYMPINSDGRISREGGFYVLNYMSRTNNKFDLSTAVVNSSEATIRKKMNEKGFENVAFIHNSSMYDLTSEFKNFFSKDTKNDKG